MRRPSINTWFRIRNPRYSSDLEHCDSHSASTDRAVISPSHLRGSGFKSVLSSVGMCVEVQKGRGGAACGNTVVVLVPKCTKCCQVPTKEVWSAGTGVGCAASLLHY